MRLLPLLLAFTLASCSSSTTPTETKPTPEAKEAKAKKPKAPKPQAEEGEEGEEKADKEQASGAPVLRTGRYRIPLKSITDADLEPLAKALIAAWEKSAKEGDATTPEPKTKVWKCRHATAWDLQGPEPIPQLRLFERMSANDCKAPDAKEDKWELSLRYALTARPEKKDGGGKLRFLMASQDFDRTDGKWAESFGTIYRQESPDDAAGGFSHDDAWLKEQLPAGYTMSGKKAEMDSWRWAIGDVVVGGEKVTVEAERWNCLGTDKAVGAELVFRTNKRGAGHTPTAPKDVVITEPIKKFADAFVAELGDRVGGEGNVSAAAMTCAQ